MKVQSTKVKNWQYFHNRPFQMRAWSCVTSYYSPLRGSHCHTLHTVNPAMGMMLCSSMLAFEKVYTTILSILGLFVFIWTCSMNVSCWIQIHQWKVEFQTFLKTILPFPYTSAPARLRLPVPHVSTKSLKSSLSSHAKILFYIWNERIKYCKRYHYEVNWSVLHVNC